jgi:hypothetical protein
VIIKRQPVLSQRIAKISLVKGSLSITNDHSRLLVSDVERLKDDYLERVNTVGSKLMPIDNAVNDLIIENIKRRNAVGILREDDCVVGGIIGVKTKFDTYSGDILHHTFYNSNLKGVAAVHAAVLSFQFLIKYAETHGIDYVYAQAASWDAKLSLINILHRDGWYTEGHSAIFNVKERSCHL